MSQREKRLFEKLLSHFIQMHAKIVDAEKGRDAQALFQKLPFGEAQGTGAAPFLSFAGIESCLLRI
ncbi:MAG: hypothetical protein A2Y28_04535 [Chlamydiae bacterium GWC2_50_10]|nr:MAG: hypothetical protein A2Z85_02795 [Chlamydiae bacterium GWA2_50_15]OGN54023.1 MAG: hypothetical protein A2098_00370 [Chlamydiae bacterium GWF2_49_8]OGN54917.1 MAG: hypothetical protein A2Y28_04535 [Chlamydiae bacterium GWC2_50_10]OGN57225.1 MAG: hypothetical protein A3D18_00130 [Chlamydiae bacterium RIFCSPHIGHO2_02_FULL_49_29]OGN62861.1 MAG: hypothetical protein A3E26_01815 [Chlamydiae bacterium RIFCSPHIGHO2_12_FULL_49_32]